MQLTYIYNFDCWCLIVLTISDSQRQTNSCWLFIMHPFKPCCFFTITVLIFLSALAGRTSATRTYPMAPNGYRARADLETSQRLMDLQHQVKGEVASHDHAHVLSNRPKIPPSGPSHRTNKTPNSSRHLLIVN